MVQIFKISPDYLCANKKGWVQKVQKKTRLRVQPGFQRISYLFYQAKRGKSLISLLTFTFT